jgi:hypothetical protein
MRPPEPCGSELLVSLEVEMEVPEGPAPSVVVELAPPAMVELATSVVVRVVANKTDLVRD